MIEHYPHITPEKAHTLLAAVQDMPHSSRGADRRCYLLDDCAVLRSDRLKLRNVITRDDDLRHLNSLIDTLMTLSHQGVAVVPILGYCCEEESADGTGFLLEQRACGEPLYDDALLSHFAVWTQDLPPEDHYLTTDLSAAQAAQYLLSRTHVISQVPQVHFTRFVADMRTILRADLLIDAMGKSNFFYDAHKGFQFIDIDAHNDFYYGLEPTKMDEDFLTALYAFAPCHFSVGTKAFAPIALDENALSVLSAAQRSQLHADNQAIFTNCLCALRENGVSESHIASALDRLKFF